MVQFSPSYPLSQRHTPVTLEPTSFFSCRYFFPVKTDGYRCFHHLSSTADISHPLCFLSASPSFSIKVANKSRLPYSWAPRWQMKAGAQERTKSILYCASIAYWSSFQLQLFSQSLWCSYSTLTTFISTLFSLSCLSKARLDRGRELSVCV